MPSLRILEGKVRFRLSKEELQTLEQQHIISLSQPFGSFAIITSDRQELITEGGVAKLLIRPQDITELMEMEPSREGISFNQDDMSIHLEVNIKKSRNS
ncbi:MAG: hypothetical protein ACK5MJ_03965 [Alphaproteobacteria bacterium]